MLAYFFLPDTPGTAKPNWIFSERVSAHIRRLSLMGRGWLILDLGYPTCPGENEPGRTEAGRQAIYHSHHPRLFDVLEDPPLHVDLYNAAVWVATFPVFRLLAQGPQQEGPTDGLYSRSDRKCTVKFA